MVFPCSKATRAYEDDEPGRPPEEEATQGRLHLKPAQLFLMHRKQRPGPRSQALSLNWAGGDLGVCFSLLRVLQNKTKTDD